MWGKGFKEHTYAKIDLYPLQPEWITRDLARPIHPFFYTGSFLKISFYDNKKFFNFNFLDYE